MIITKSNCKVDYEIKLNAVEKWSVTLQNGEAINIKRNKEKSTAINVVLSDQLNASIRKPL